MLYNLCLTAVQVLNTCGSLKMATSLQPKHQKAVKLIVLSTGNKPGRLASFCWPHTITFPTTAQYSIIKLFPHTCMFNNCVRSPHILYGGSLQRVWDELPAGGTAHRRNFLQVELYAGGTALGGPAHRWNCLQVGLPAGRTACRWICPQA
jgi:hypothetical protein